MKKIVTIVLFLVACFQANAQFNFLNAYASAESCTGAANGSICWTLTGGTSPYFINILGTTTPNSFTCANNLSAMTYTIVATDATSASTSTVVVVGTNSAMLKIFVNDSTVCAGDSVTISPMYTSNGIINSNGYCTPIIASDANEDIINVSIGNINNSTSCTSIGAAGSIVNKYNNYTNLATTISPSVPLPFSITVGNCNSGAGTNNSTAIYIDYNADGDFNDLGEQAYLSASSSAGSHVETGTIYPPNILQSGVSRMRIVNLTGAPSVLNSCGSFAYGEVEDYTVFFNITPMNIYWTDGTFGSSDTAVTAYPSATTVYTLTVDYGNGCLDSATTIVTVFAQPIVNVFTNNITCPNANLQAIVTNGTYPFVYTWLPGNTSTQSITNLSNGVYTCNIVDSNSCKATTTYSFTASTPISASPTKTDVKCFGDSTGAIALGTIGGLGPYTYTWTPSVASGASPTNIPAGTYQVQITDANGCIYATSVIITQPNAKLEIILTSTNATAFGAADGTAKVIASGGTVPYQFLWAPNGKTSDTMNGVIAGTYTITVTDNNGCTSVGAVIISQPNGIAEWNKLYNLQVAPNPSSDYININSQVTISNLEILNVQGQLVQSQTANSKQIKLQIGQLPNGIYLLKVNGLIARKIEMRR